MTQASNLIAFPQPIALFEPVTIDVKKVITSYDSYRPVIAIVLRVLEKTPAQISAADVPLRNSRL